MSKVIILLTSVIFGLGASVMSSQTNGPQQQSNQNESSDPASAVKVTITTGGGLFGPPKSSYKVGEQIPVSITMTNTSTEPIYVCDSDTLYQDHPELRRDGKTLPYGKWQSFLVDDSTKNSTCNNEDLPEQIILRPNEPKVIDWFILVDSTDPTGAIAWYDSLPAGNYELSIQRRFGCCDGPMVQSNKINFEVTP
jgi:hypothetical protein